MADWYVFDKNKKIEKLSGKEIQLRVANGSIARDFQIGKAESGPWTPIAELKGLKWPEDKSKVKKNAFVDAVAKAVLFGIIVCLTLAALFFGMVDQPSVLNIGERFDKSNAYGATANGIELLTQKIDTLIGLGRFFYMITVVAVAKWLIVSVIDKLDEMDNA